jgi:serine/threonine protein kinase
LTLAHLPAHAGIPPLLDFARTAKATHLVLALAPGEELFTYVNAKPDGHLDELEARKVVAGILEALRHTHANSVLHRDIKLDNIFWNGATETVSLIDFGLATFFNENTTLDEGVGCINYASPSLLRLTNFQRPYLPRAGHSDLHALGVLTHGILTGFFPFKSEEPFDLMMEIAEHKPFALEGLSESGNDFLNTLLSPANEGKISAETLLNHPWVSDVAPPRSGRLASSKPPKLASSMDIRRAIKVAEAALAQVLPSYLSETASIDETASLLSRGSMDTFHGVVRSGSETSWASSSSEATVVAVEPRRVVVSGARPTELEPVKRKNPFATKLLNPSKWFDGLKGGKRR